MKRKQMMALLLCGVMAASLGLTACGGEKKDPAKETANASAAEDTVDEDGKVNGVFYEKGLPVVDKGDYKFSIFVDGTLGADNFYMLEKIKEQTGIDVDLQIYAYEVAQEKFSLALSSGDYADCIGGWCLSPSDILKYGVNQHIFVPLEDYFEKYAPNIQKLLDEIPGVREAVTAPDGHIYSIPYVLDAPMVDYSIGINKRWLDNLGLEVPTTTEEYYEVLKAFKEQDANGNGDPNDEIPLSFDPNNKHINYLPGWFGMSCDDNGMTMKDGELMFGANTDEFKEGIKFVNKLYSEGLVDTEAFTQDLSQWKAKGGQDLFGSTMMYGSGDFMPYNAGEVPDFVPLPVLSSENCDHPVWFQDSNGTSVLKNQVVITNKAKEIGAIVRFWDTVYDYDNSIQIINGPLDDVVFKEDDGYHKIDMTTRSEEDQTKYSWANLFPQALPHNIPLGFKLIEDPATYPEKDVQDEAYKDNLTGTMPPYWMPLDKADTMAEIETAIRDYIEQKTAEWIAGQSDIDSDWEDYCKQLETFGLEEYVQMRKDTAAAPAAAEDAAAEETTEE